MSDELPENPNENVNPNGLGTIEPNYCSGGVIGPNTETCSLSDRDLFAGTSRNESSCSRTNEEVFNGLRCLQNSLDSYRSVILTESSGQICANELNEALLENVIKIHTLLSTTSGSVETEIPSKPIQYFPV